MLGAITSPLEWYLAKRVWVLQAQQAKAAGLPIPPRPHRVRGGPKGLVIPDGICVGRPQGSDQPQSLTLK
jgi:hypothetical protein